MSVTSKIGKSAKGLLVWSLGVSALALSACQPTQAQDSSGPLLSQTLERLETAYGGEALHALKTVSIERDRRLAWPGQGQSAELVEFVPYRLINHYDLEKQLGSQESWIRQNGNIYHDGLRLTEAGARRSDYFTLSYTDLRTRDYFRIFGSGYRLSDTLMAHALTRGLADISYQEDVYYKGEMHDVLSAVFASEEQPMEIYVSKSSGRITRLNMDRPLGRVTIIFDGFRDVDGLTYASENRLFIGDRLVEYEYDIDFRANETITDSISFDSTLSPAATLVETDEMTIDRVAPNLYLVGQGEYSLFAIEDDKVMAVNGDAGVIARYGALMEHLGADIPLTDVVLTHHHEDHIQGAMPAFERGARLWVTGETQKVLRAEHPDAEFSLRVIQSGEALGPFTLYVKPTGHAAENAFIYHRASKSLFQDDHYHGLVVDGPSRVQPTALEVAEMIHDLELEVSTLLSGHAKKAESWAVFQQGLRQNQADNPCPSGRKICRDQLSTL